IRQSCSPAATPGRRQRAYPAVLWQVVQLCVELLDEDAIPVDPASLASYAELFEQHGAGAHPLPESDDRAMTLRVGDRVLRLTSVRDLLEHTVALLDEHGIDAEPALPWLMGRTRHLVGHAPFHSNGTPFIVPMPIGKYVFEGHLARAQALAEVIRFLSNFGLEVSSPDIEQPRRDEVDEPDELPRDDGDQDDDGTSEAEHTPNLSIQVAPPAQDELIPVEGSTVRR